MKIKVPLQEGKWMPMDDKNQAYNKITFEINALLDTKLKENES